MGVGQQHGLIKGCSLEESFGVFLGLMRGVGIFANSLEKLASNPSCLELVDGVLALNCLIDFKGESVPVILSCASILSSKYHTS